jgi:hypothetical protein
MKRVTGKASVSHVHIALQRRKDSLTVSFNPMTVIEGEPREYFHRGVGFEEWLERDHDSRNVTSSDNVVVKSVERGTFGHSDGGFLC